MPARRAQQLSQAEVAALTRGRPGQISRAMVSLIERGRHLPGLEATLVLGNDALGVESSWGLSSSGIRNGAIASGQCGNGLRNNTPTCP